MNHVIHEQVAKGEIVRQDSDRGSMSSAKAKSLLNLKIDVNHSDTESQEDIQSPPYP